MKKNNNNKNNKIRREENIEKSQLQEIFICQIQEKMKLE